MSQPVRPSPRARHPLRWPAIAVAAGVLAAGSILLAAGKPGIVTTTAGQTFEGDVTEADGKVTVVRGGFRATVPAEEVRSIEYSTYGERFARDLAALAPDDIDGRVALARQAIDRREFRLAERALDEALEIDPLHREARRVSIGLGAQLQMEAKQAGRAAASTRPVGDPAGPRPQRRLKGLDDAQQNQVRQAELRRGDRVRVRFANNVRKRFVDSQQGGMTYRQFDTLPDGEQALMILSRGTRDMVDDVIIQTDPAAIATFNRRVQSAVVQGCATSRCHGGDHAGNFKLVTGVPDASTAITNFYLVTTWSRDLPPTEGALFSGGTLEMVSRGRATDSVLYQYALPRAKARVKHPTVRGWDGLFRDGNDRLAVELTEWINRELQPVRPTYDFQYSPFTAPATTEPADGATTNPTTGPTLD